MRIWWCPTGPLAFLPIHAASPYDGNTPGLPELVISSYVPTLRSLFRAHDIPHTPLSLLARVCARISRVPTTMVGPSATVDAVTATLRRAAHTWLHFSCHAYQDPSNAFASAFFMHDGPLTLGALMQLDLSRVQFAFLSACLTSAGDERLPDESIHLAAGLQFAGVRSVVATLWTVDDRKAAVVADKVYDYLLRESADEPIRLRRRRHFTTQ
ncbi:CHAT domain-containing protein [Trametes polyzona]|nr:CHAT domain-containing protein [Trametes polyzona]